MKAEILPGDIDISWQTPDRGASAAEPDNESDGAEDSAHNENSFAELLHPGRSNPPYSSSAAKMTRATSLPSAIEPCFV